MATTCFGPPPLPPQNQSKKNKVVVQVEHHQPKAKSGGGGGGGKKKVVSVAPTMSSTYRSFRDPIEEDEIVVMASEDMEVKPILEKRKRKASKYNTNSLTRPLSASRMTLARSHSEGNLAAAVPAEQNLSLPPIGAGALNKCLRVLSGSWKNLFQCE